MIVHVMLNEEKGKKAMVREQEVPFFNEIGGISSPLQNTRFRKKN